MSFLDAYDRYYEARLSFGPYTVDTARRVVLRDGTPLRLTLRCVELLIAFLRNPGQALTKEQLIEAAWHDPTASDATLAQHVFMLRRALKDDGSELIRTVPQVGYRFSGTVTADRDVKSTVVREFARGAATFRSLMTHQGLQSAIELYSRIIELDRANADAYAGRARCSRLLAQFMYADPLACLSAAKRDAQMALGCDVRNVEALVEAAHASALFDRDWHTASAHVRSAERRQPDHPEVGQLRASLHLMHGDVHGALRAHGNRPGPLHATLLYLNRQYKQAREELSIGGGDSLVRLLYSACRLFEGDVLGARDDFTAMYREEIDLRASGQPNVRHYALAFLIYTNARGVDVPAAHQGIVHLARLSRERYVSPMARAIAHVGLGERDAALSFLEEAVSRRDPWTAHIAVDPFMDDLRGDARFTRLLHVVAGDRAA